MKSPFNWKNLLRGSGKTRVGAAVLFSFGMGFVLLNGGGSNEPVSDGLTYTATLEPFTIRLTESGSIESRSRITIKSEVPGNQTVIYLIPEGTMVEEGDLLVEFDSSQFQDKLVEEEIELENAEAELISARENLAVVENQAEANIAAAELAYAFAKQDLDNYREGEFAMSLQQADSKITLARAELQQAEDRLAGSRELFRNKYISATELESDELARQRAEMDLKLALQEKELLESFTYQRQIAQLESDVKQAGLALERAQRRARADIAQAEARLSARRAEVQREKLSTRTLQDRIDNCRIVAPTRGMVIYAPQGNRWNDIVLEEGSSVRERQELIYLPTTPEMIAKVRVHESMLNKLAIGQQVRIEVDAVPGQIFTGAIETIAVMPKDGGWRNPDLKEYETTVGINEISDRLRSGMTCKAEIQIAHFDEALTLPVQSVLQVDGSPTVFLPGAKGEPVPRRIRIGMDNNRKVRVLEGLDAGVSVLLNPPLEAAEQTAASGTPEREREGTTADLDSGAGVETGTSG